MKNFLTAFFLLAFVFTNAQDFKFGKVSEEEVHETAHPVDKDANAAVLYRKVSTYYQYNSGGFVLVTDVHERVKIYNKDGFDWATKELSHYQNGSDREKIAGLKGYTYNIVDGKLKDEKLKKDGIFEEEASKYQLKTRFTMPAVTEGSVIEYQYSLLSPFVTTIDDIVLQYTIPINKIEASVSIPEFLGFKKHFNTRSPIQFAIEESSKSFSTIKYDRVRNEGRVVSHSTETSQIEYNQNVYSIVKENIPALKKEAYVDYLWNYAAVLKWELQFTKFPNSIVENYSQSWEDVSKTIYADSYGKELNRSGYFDKDLDKILAGVSDPREKATRIFNFAKSKIKWNNYAGFIAENGGAKAYKQGEGNVADINLALGSMLKYAGLKTYPVLLSTKDNGIPLFPTRKGFNYIIAAVELGDEMFLLDATEENIAFGELPERARNWLGRILLDKETSDWVDLMPTYQSVNHYTLNLQFDDNLMLKGKNTNLLNGYYAKTFRDSYKNINEDSYIEILEKDKGNIVISDLKIENQVEVGKEITQVYNFELANGMEMINDKIYLTPLLFLAERENPFKAEKREYPIFFDFPSAETKTVNIMVPEGYEVEYLPESALFDLNGGAGTFKFITLQNGNFLRIVSELNMKNTVFTSNDYKSLKEFYAQLVTKHTEAIVLKRI